MHLILGFIIIFIFSVIFSHFQGFIDFLIDIGLFPEKYRKNANFDIMMIFVLHFLFMATAFIGAGILYVFGASLDWNLNRKIKKAKKTSQKKYGTTAPYFYFLEPKTILTAPLDKLNYVWEINQQYLYEKYEDWDKVEEILKNLSNIEELKLYHEAIDYYRLPDIPKEYEIFGSYTDEELAQFQK
ncbi:hypothetical protein BKP35_16415 [Anaerobacillus arseniciselenatis]|uniref:Uncharacterized protein n=1 Tax=Anaerobacillus arseniciselenatis TaxID=85682 RepID=A0A1S2LCI6_9BACI|nr:hypothetical protein [Anaerobacillus arseniciselenatis]OIJ09437.1 hypothetical protein BKP35_16415 [Anaerobacillus arseniciselenatis]